MLLGLMGAKIGTPNKIIEIEKHQHFRISCCEQ